jgi:dipeptidyl-peptidase-4
MPLVGSAPCRDAGPARGVPASGRPDARLLAGRAAVLHRLARRRAASSTSARRAASTPSAACGCSRSRGRRKRLVFDPGEEEAERDLTEAERARRERARERSSGVTRVRDRRRRAARGLLRRRPPVPRGPGRGFGPRADARPVASTTPGSTARASASRSWSTGRSHVREIEGGVRELAAPEQPDTFWGLPEFVAAEEMNGCAGTGGRPTARGSPWLTSTSATSSSGTSPTRPIRRPAPRGALPAGGHERRRRDAVGVRPRERRARRGAVGSRALPVPVARPVGRRPADAARPDAGPEDGAATRGVPKRPARPRSCRSARTPSGSTSSTRAAAAADGRIVDVRGRSRDRHVSPHRGRRARDAGRAAGAQVLSAGEGVLFRASDGDPTEIHLWRWTRGRRGHAPDR